MGRTGPAKELGAERPQGALISVLVLGSLLLQTALLITVQVLSYFITVSQSWYGTRLPAFVWVQRWGQR